MSLIKFDRFESVQHVTPKPVLYSYDQMVSWLSEFRILEKKEDRKACFSFTEYKEGRTRGKDNISFMTGIVFDFDNKLKPIKPIEEITRILEQHDVMHFWYDTFQSTAVHPRWRLIIPFDKKVAVEDWENVYQKVFNFIGTPSGVDIVSKKTAQLYFDPCQPKGVLLKSHFFKGNILDIDKIPERILPQKIEVKKENLKRNDKKNFSNSNNIDRISKALIYISPDIDYDSWIKIGMALKSELGASGFNLWNQWSRQGSKYKGEKDVEHHWNSFNKSGIGLGTVFSMAQENGFDIYENVYEKKYKNFAQYSEQKCSTEEENVIDETLEEIINSSLAKLEKYATVNIFDIPSSLVKELYEWLENSSKIFQPVYSLATTLSIIAFLKRNSIISPTKLRTNLYILSIGPSRSGKNNGLERIFQVLSELGSEQYLTSGVGSHQGLLKQLKENNGSLFWKQDELSYLLRGFNNKNANTYEQNIEQKLLTLYNCKYQTTDATKSDKLERIKDPYLNIYSTATEQILEVLKPQSAISGLLARFLIFWVHPGEPYKDNFNPHEDIPADLLAELISLESQKVIKPALFAPDAKEWYGKFLQEVRDAQRVLSENGTKVDSLVGNLPEQSVKLSLLVAPYEQMWPQIRLEDIKWGVSVAMHCLQNNIAIANSFSDNQNEKIVNKIREKIKQRTKDGKWITKSSLWRAVRYIANSRQLDEILTLLSEGGDIEKHYNNSSRGYRVRWKQKTDTNK